MNPFGPLSRQQFETLVDAPFGEALEIIRSYDPLYGRKPDEKIRWRITFKRDIPEIGTAYVTAATEEEAHDLAQKIPEAEISWDVDDSRYYDDAGTIEKVEPDRNTTPMPSVDPFPF